jgi:RNA polymerase sigma-70 factor (ECF subfamily)
MQGSTSRDDIFSRVFQLVYPIIFRVTLRITGREDLAEEVCQEAFIRYYDRVDRFPSDDEAKYWLIRVAKNLALNVAKRSGREVHAYERVAFERDEETPSGEDELLRKETEREVQAALERLPAKMKSVLVLKEYGQLSYKEIGSVLGISEGNVKVRVHRARERLQKLLQEGTDGST